MKLPLERFVFTEKAPRFRVAGRRHEVTAKSQASRIVSFLMEKSKLRRVGGGPLRGDRPSPGGAGADLLFLAVGGVRLLGRLRGSGGRKRDGIEGDGVKTQKLLAIDQRWRRSVRVTPRPGNNTTGPSVLPDEAACGAERLFECLWYVQTTRAMFALAGALSFFGVDAQTLLRRASATGLFCTCLGQAALTVTAS